MTGLNKTFQVVVLLLVGITGANGQRSDHSISERELQAAFKQIVGEYDSFEAVHGNSITTPNVNMHYLTWGKNTDRVFVWIHGTTSNAYEAALFADSLVSNGYFVIAVDYYGHGKTPIPAREVSIYNVADDIHFLLTTLKIDKVTIGGWSRGGTIATAFYDTYPDMVSAIVLEDGGSVGWLRPGHRMEGSELAKLFDDNKQQYGEVPADKLFPSLYDAFRHHQHDGKLRLLTFHAINKTTTGQWGVNPGLAEWLGEESWESIVKSINRPAAAPLFEFSTMTLEPRIAYRNLKVPMLIFDPIDVNDQLKDFHQDNAHLKNEHPDLVTHLVYDNTSHAVKYQRPDRFREDLVAFLKGVESEGP